MSFYRLLPRFCACVYECAREHDRSRNFNKYFINLIAVGIIQRRVSPDTGEKKKKIHEIINPKSGA